MSTIDDQLRDGNLDGARATLVAAVQTDPAAVRHRLALADLLIVLGDYDRADIHLNAAQELDVSYGMAVALTRQLLRAATWRRETFDSGRPPELVSPRTPGIDVALTALLAERDGKDAPMEDPTALVTIVGTVDDRPFVGWRDADDRTAGVLEVLTSTGNYVWVPLEHIRAMRLEPVERLRDLVWRAAEVDITDGPTGVVYLPMIYHAAVSEQTAQHRLGRATDWIEGTRVRGLGLRTWLIGEDDLAPTDFTRIAVGS